MGQLLADEVRSTGLRFRSFFFRCGVISALILPLWWSSVALSPPAARVAIGPESELTLAEDSKTFTATLALRNLSGRPLFAKKKGTMLTWWDDESPVTEEAFFSSTRVPNGEFTLTLPTDTELKDGFAAVTYTGNVSEAILTPRSYGVFDFMGGPEDEAPTKEQYSATRASFEHLLHKNRRGRIDVTFAIITKGGRLSKRTVTILKTN